jgi:4-amino-4-deoxy-L-arabinose transferase-like glycosyltransferase
LQFSTLAKPLTLALLLAIIVFYLYGLGHLPLVGPDEARYAQVAREMFDRGDLITPTLGGHLWFEKPALLYWLMIGSYTFFGVSEWSVRLGPAVCGLFSIFALFWLGNRVSRAVNQMGLCSALMLASSLGFIVFSRAASFDVVVTMTLTWALAFFIASEIADNDKQQRRLLVGFYIFIGLSLLAKGLIGLVIPLGIVGAYFAVRRKGPAKLVWTSLIWGLPLSALVAATWYGPVLARHGSHFVDEFIVQHHFARYLSNTYHHPAPVYFYLVILVLLSLPWTPFAVDALLQARKWLWKPDDTLTRMRTFALAWIVVPLVFFSFSNSKLPGYILPVLPALALLGGERLSTWLDDGTRARWAMRATGLVCLALAVSALIYSARTGEIPTQVALMITAPCIIAGTLTMLPMIGRVIQMWSIAIAVAALALGALHVTAPGHAAQDTAKFLLQQANERGYGRTAIYGLQRDDRTPEFYAAGRVTYADDGEPVMYVGLEQIDNEIKRRGGPVLVFVPDDDAQLFASQPNFRTVVIASNGRHSLIAVGPLGEWR